MNLNFNEDDYDFATPQVEPVDKSSNNLKVEKVDIIGAELKLVDPKKKEIEKSRTAFLAFNVRSGQVNISAFLARKMGIMSGDRIGFVNIPKPKDEAQKLVWFIYKTTQMYRTAEVKIRNGTYSMHVKAYVNEIGDSFCFNPAYNKTIRLYVNHDYPIEYTVDFGGVKQKANIYQIFDMPELREDFNPAFPELKKEYIGKMSKIDYIVKIDKQ